MDPWNMEYGQLEKVERISFVEGEFFFSRLVRGVFGGPGLERMLSPDLGGTWEDVVHIVRNFPHRAFYRRS